MRDHIRILGILNLIMGAFVALAGVVLLLIMGSVAAYLAGAMSNGSGDREAAPIIGSVGIGVAIFLFLLAAPTLIGGWGLMRFRPWSRLLMIIISVLHLFSVPLGTALGVYGLWVLFNDEARRILESGGTYQGIPAAVYPANVHPSSPGSYPPPPASRVEDPRAS
jgi:hypothetical protein